MVDLIRLKTLADAGVPLARVSELLRAEPEQFSSAIDEIDRGLRDEIRRIQRHRMLVARLAAGDSLALPDEVVDYLARLRRLGMSERIIEVERDGWILLTVHFPDRVTEWIGLKQQALNDAEFRDLYLTFDRSFDWQPDDPRLSGLAEAFSAYLRGWTPRPTGQRRSRPRRLPTSPSSRCSTPRPSRHPLPGNA